MTSRRLFLFLPAILAVAVALRRRRQQPEVEPQRRYRDYMQPPSQDDAGWFEYQGPTDASPTRGT